jgi:GT2 family glycosyltransferase
LAPHALYLAARHAADDANLQVIYGDEDELTAADGRQNPFFKSGWNPELILAFNYIGSPVFWRTELARLIGGARAVVGDAWRWDMVLRASEQIDAEAIQRIPFVLYHQAAPEHRRRREIAAGGAALVDALARRKLSGTPIADRRGWFSIKRRLSDRPPHVTIIIPTCDRCDLLRRCLAGVLDRTAYPSFDVVIVDNRSEEKETIDYLGSLQRDPRVRVAGYADDFNFAAMHNQIIASARGEIVALLSNDVDVIGTDWLNNMVAHALDPRVGAVGAKLYYPDGKVQHACVVIGLGGACGHLFHRRDRVDLGPAALLMASQDVSAVTGACMVMRRSVFAEVRGFDEAFAIDYNDIDLCLRIREHGYRVVWAADAELYHLEAATRGTGHNSQDGAHQAKRDRFQRETARFKEKWKHLLDDDPLYNPNQSGGGRGPGRTVGRQGAGSRRLPSLSPYHLGARAIRGKGEF